MLKIGNYYGNFALKEVYDVDTNSSFYDVYDNKDDSDDVNDMEYIGEFMPKHFFDFEDEEEEKQLFCEEFLDWCAVNQM